MSKHHNQPQKRRIKVGTNEMDSYGLHTHFWQDFYYYSMTLTWPRFFAAVAGLFILLNLIFASLYLLGDNAIGNLNPKNFLGAFYFSVETLATVGYGDMHPQTNYGHVIATIEIFIGMSGIAMITGLMFARFSRPRSSILFADHPVSHLVQGKRHLLIRMANARMNVISEASAKLRLIRDETLPVVGHFRKIYDLKLERDQHPVFVLGWTIVHVIDETSPLFGLSPVQLADIHAALIVSVEGVDETTSQTQRSRQFYPCESIRWNHKYVDVFAGKENGVQQFHHHKFHLSEEVAAEMNSQAALQQLEQAEAVDAPALDTKQA